MIIEKQDIHLDYSPFDETLKRKGLTRNRLKEEYGISSGMLSRMTHNRDMRLSTAAELMLILDIDDFNQFVKFQ